MADTQNPLVACPCTPSRGLGVQRREARYLRAHLAGSAHGARVDASRRAPAHTARGGRGLRRPRAVALVGAAHDALADAATNAGANAGAANAGPGDAAGAGRLARREQREGGDGAEPVVE